MVRTGKIVRRIFLFGAVVLAGGAAIGWWKYKTPYGNPSDDDLAEGAATLNPYVMIDANGVTIVAPRAEMGQGVHTTLAALVAEEMDLVLADVTVIHGPASAAYFNAGVLEESAFFLPIDTGWLAETVRGGMHIPGKFLGLQITGGSSSIIDAFDKMRLAGAAARAALVQAAAARLNVAADTLKTEGSAVVAPGGTRLLYTDLAANAAKQSLSATPEPKLRANWRLLGKTPPRVDMLAKATGTAEFTADLRFATAHSNPNLGAAMNGYDATAALAMPEVEKIVPIIGGVAVVATSTWAALQAAQVISFDWIAASYPADSAAITQTLNDSFNPDCQDSRNRDDCDVDAALTGDVFQAAYSAPYFAHATMEPMTAAAQLKDGHLTVWAGNQLPTQILTEGAALTRLPIGAIAVETRLMGGGFGRRAEMDIIRQAITVAIAMQGTPVLLTWSREEDMTHDIIAPPPMPGFVARSKAA